MFDYIEKHQWVGKGNANCTDPKILRNQISATKEDLMIENFLIKTYDMKYHPMYLNDTSLHWAKTYQIHPDLDRYDSTVCHTMTISEDLTKLGINEIYIFLKNDPFLMITVHQRGLLYTDMPDTFSFFFLVPKSGFIMPIVHEVVHLLDYNGEECQKDMDYKLDECM